MTNEYTLEQSRNDKIKTLGFLCYNLCVDGVMNFSEMVVLVNAIKEELNYLLELRNHNATSDFQKLQEENLNEKLTELGCICYNLYVDNKLFNNNLMLLCDSISTINQELIDSLKTDNQSDFNDVNSEKSDNEYRNATESRLKVTCPYGMEPIPVNFKQCICGYRNRSEAKYCGKCGAKLS